MGLREKSKGFYLPVGWVFPKLFDDISLMLNVRRLCVVVDSLIWCENKTKVIRRPCDFTSGNLSKTSVREKSRGVYLAIPPRSNV